MLELLNISKTVKVGEKEIDILRDITMYLPDRGMYFIHGKSGSGKTTLLNIMEGLDLDYFGTIKFKGKTLPKKKEKINNYLKNNVSILFQNNNLNLCETAFENVLDALLISGKNLKTSKNEANVLFEKYNLNEIKDKKCMYLSGGQRQRVAFLRAIAKKSDILFCDEPTGALDSLNSKLIMDMIKEISKERLVIIVSHDEEIVANYSDFIFEIADGTVLTNSEKKDYIKEKRKKKENESKIFHLFLKDIFQNKRSYFIIFFALIFTFTLLFTSLSIKSYSENIGDDIFSTYIVNNYVKVTNEIPIKNNESDINLYIEERPKFSDIESCPCFENFYYDLSFEYLFSSATKIKNKKAINITYLPSLKTKFLANRAFFDEIEEFNIDLEFNIKANEFIENEYIQDVCNFTINFEYELVEEFSYNMEPRLYYPYLYIKEELENHFFDILSDKNSEKISVYSYIANKPNNEIASSYSLDLFESSGRKINVDKLNNELKNTTLVCSNPLFEVSNLYENTIVSLINYFIVLFISSIIGLIFIIEFLLYESIQNSKRKIAIYEFLGLKIEIYKIIKVLQHFLLILISFFIGYLINFQICKLINGLIYSNFNVGMNIQFNTIFYQLNTNQFLFLIWFSFTVLVYLGSYFPLKRLEKIDIKKELNSL